MKHCTKCGIEFGVAKEDKDFYEKLDTKEPEICPICRQQKRLAFRNERNLYGRKCDLCEKQIVSIYSPDKSFKVYCQDCFWGDKWNALDYGMEPNFEKPFFEQFETLMQKVPRLAIVNKKSENSDYCNYSFANKNCYLTFGNHYEWDCLYGHYSTKNKNCIDYLWLYKSELCYECMFSKNCYNSIHLEHSEGCRDCLFSIDLKSCEHCLFCANLRHKKYHIFNEEYSKEEYFKKLKSYKLQSYKGFEEAKRIYKEDLREKFPMRAFHQTNCEDCQGSNHENSKNLRYCFDCTACEDCGYGFQMDETYDSMDMSCMGYDRSELCYQTIGCSGLFNCMTCDSCWHGNDLRYCNMCFSSKDLFGCISLQHQENCILNKKYSKEEYEKLMLEIVEHMKKTGEWGEFFPSSISPFGYNESVAQEYFQSEKEKALEEGFKWSDYKTPELEVEKTIKAEELPDDIDLISDDILNWAIKCKETGKPFKLIPQELKFYREHKLPIPREHPEVRHQNRMKLRTPRRLWLRQCDKCKQQIYTTYSPNRPEQIYCQKCYEENVYK